MELDNESLSWAFARFDLWMSQQLEDLVRTWSRPLPLAAQPKRRPKGRPERRRRPSQPLGKSLGPAGPVEMARGELQRQPVPPFSDARWYERN